MPSRVFSWDLEIVASIEPSSPLGCILRTAPRTKSKSLRTPSKSGNCSELSEKNSLSIVAMRKRILPCSQQRVCRASTHIVKALLYMTSFIGCLVKPVILGRGARRASRLISLAREVYEVRTLAYINSSGLRRFSMHARSFVSKKLATFLPISVTISLS